MLYNTIDFHIHASPDIAPRKQSIFEVTQTALSAGMKGVVFKSHGKSVADDVNSVKKELNTDICYSSIVLNEFIGFNAEKVKEELDSGVSIVYMPTLDAATHKGEAGISILKKGVIRQDVLAILKLVAQYNVILASGHLSYREVRQLVLAAKNSGVEKILITHPDLKLNAMPVEVQQELTQFSVYFERTFFSCIHPNFPEKETDEFEVEQGQKYSIEKVKELVDHIRKTGVENNIVDSDLGQPSNIDPVPGFAFFLEKLKENGLTDEEIDFVARKNPAKLLGL